MRGRYPRWGADELYDGNLTYAVGLLPPGMPGYSDQLESVAEHMYTYGWVADYPDPENFLDLLLHSESRDSRYRNPRFDSLLIRARSEPVRDIRLKFYGEAEQLLMDDAGIIPLFHVKDYVLVHSTSEASEYHPSASRT